LVTSAAAAARAPVSSANLFFQNDEELILAIYLRLAGDLQAHASALPEGGVAARFRALMTFQAESRQTVSRSFRRTLRKNAGSSRGIGVFSQHTELVRLRTRAAFAQVVHGADDAPDSKTELIQGLYAAHLALLLIWSQDRTPELKSTNAALEMTCKLVGLVCQFRWLPPSAGMLESVGAICGPLVDPPADPNTTSRAREILRLVYQHRRLLPGSANCPAAAGDGLCEQCLEPHLPLVRRFVMAGLPVHFVLPAFPAKSPNPSKVLGLLPDMAEELSLRFLNDLCEEIRKIHEPGARVTICSDGMVFADLVGVADSDVAAYGERIVAMIALFKLASLEAFHMQDLYDQANSRGEMRDWLCRHYAESIEAVRERLHSNESQQALFNGIQRFLFEDRVELERTRAARAFAPNVKIALTKSFAAAMPGAASLRTVFPPRFGFRFIRNRRTRRK